MSYPKHEIILPDGSVFGGSDPAAVEAEQGALSTLMAALAAQQNGYTPRCTGSLVTAADGNAYAQGDLIGNSTTAASVVPIDFINATRDHGGSGRVTGCRAVVSCASSTIVITNLAFDLIIFRPITSIPFAVAGYPASNAALNISLAAMKEIVAIFSFDAASWRNQAGLLTAVGDHVYQAQKLNSGRPYAPYNLAETVFQSKLVGVVQAQGAWAPGAVVQTFDFILDIDQD